LTKVGVHAHEVDDQDIHALEQALLPECGDAGQA